MCIRTSASLVVLSRSPRNSLRGVLCVCAAYAVLLLTTESGAYDPLSVAAEAAAGELELSS